MFMKDEGTTLYAQTLRLCASAGFTPHIELEVADAGTIMGLVAAGCGIAILPKMFACIDIEGISSIGLRDQGACTALMIASRKGETSPLVSSFIDVAMKKSTGDAKASHSATAG